MNRIKKINEGPFSCNYYFLDYTAFSFIHGRILNYNFFLFLKIVCFFLGSFFAFFVYFYFWLALFFYEDWGKTKKRLAVVLSSFKGSKSGFTGYTLFTVRGKYEPLFKKGEIASRACRRLGYDMAVLFRLLMCLACNKVVIGGKFTAHVFLVGPRALTGPCRPNWPIAQQSFNLFWRPISGRDGVVGDDVILLYYHIFL